MKNKGEFGDYPRLEANSTSKVGSWKRSIGFEDKMDFDYFLSKLLNRPSTRTTLLVRGRRKKIKAMARFTTVNYRGDEYIKVIFDDRSFLLILPKEKELYYADRVLGRAEGISEEMIGKEKEIIYNGRKYKLGNGNDYQFCLELLVGLPLDIEGECRFSDYFPVDGPKEFLSLGWLSYNGERADLNPRIIGLEEVEILS